MKYTVGILVISDRAFSGERPDQTLPCFEKALAGNSFEIRESAIVDDDPSRIEEALKSMVDKQFDLVFTTGGTGCGIRDNTPEVTSRILTKATPGLDEAIRAFSREKSDFAIYSRAVSGLAGKTFIVNLPGSPKAVTEILSFILPTLEHPLKLVAGLVADCVAETKNHDTH